MPLTCFMLGEGALLLDCAERLREHGFQLNGIFSGDEQVRRYCAETDSIYLDSRSAFAAALTQTPFDYLFSINNSYLLPESVLGLPRRQIINYHDSPLPAYAGVNATFWALVNGETEHGVTWHLVDVGIDTGDILVQHRFPIDPNTTSIQLNLRCYQAAVDSFKELISALLTNELTGQPQDTAQRTYVSRTKRPDLFIDFQQPATRIARLGRALDFGFHLNPFGFLKLWLPTGILLAKQVRAIPATNLPTPGTIIDRQPDGLLVATSDGLLAIDVLETIAGEPVAIAALLDQCPFDVGQVLTKPTSDFRSAYRSIADRCARHQPYWVTKLAHFTLTTLPIDAPLSLQGVEKAHVASVTVRLNPAAEAAFMTNMPTVTRRTDWLLTAALLILARRGGHTSVGVGYQLPLYTELAAATAGLVADCVPFSPQFDWGAGFEQAVAAVQEEQAQLRQHLSFPRELVVSHPGLRTIGQAIHEQGFPLLIHESTDGATVLYPGKSLVVNTLVGDSCQISYDETRWSAQQMTDLIERWLILLDNLATRPTQSLSTVSLLTAAEQHRMLRDWNATDKPYPPEQTIHQLIETQVRRRPHAEAVRCGVDTLTYGQLNQQANRLAGHLHKRGVRPNALVGVCLDRSCEQVVSLLAILKAGGAYVPLDPTYPASRLDELCAQTGLDLVLTRRAWRDRLPPDGTYILLDESPTALANEPDHNLDVPATADQLAYVLFTSGSTGRAKNVAIPHRGVVRLVKTANYMQLNETVVMLGLAPLAFDASTLELWGPLTNGGCLVLMAERSPTLDVIKATIQAQAINTSFFTTSLFNVLVNSGVTELTTLTQLLMGGEAASVQHVLRARQQLPHCTLINGYGPTESTTFASFFTLSATDWGSTSVPIGRPLSNTQLYIVDAWLNPVPVGWPGELLIGGDGLARHYLHQPELTQQQFIPNPFTAQPGSRLYRTGDQARYLPDGTIEFLGRLDDQLKIRGFRIEPGEVSHRLSQYPGVSEAVVMATTSAAGQSVLVGYVVASTTALDLADLKAFLHSQLPDHLVPVLLIPLAALPLTDNGKLDKSRLPAAFSVNPATGQEATTATEAAMLPVWTAVLHIPHVNLTDNFFDLGGSSLLAMQLLFQLHRQTGAQLTMKDVFEHPTLRGLSAYVDSTGPQPISVPTALALPVEAHHPLSFAQSRLWIIHQLYDLGGAYNVPVVLRISGPLHLPTLQQCLDAVTDRHQALRTTFGHASGVPFGQIESIISVPIQVHDLPDSEPTTALDNWLMAETYRPFALDQGPLVRACAIPLGPDAWVLLLVFHHLIYDGWSTRILANELSVRYNALTYQRPVSVPEQPIQYADYARQQVFSYSPEIRQKELTYWQCQLAGAPFLLNLPLDHARPSLQTFVGADHSFAVPDALWQQLQHGLKEPGTTSFLRLLAIFVAWMHQVARTDDVVIGIPVAGRNDPSLEHLIGFFVNTLPLRVVFSPHLTFRQLLQQVRQVALDAYAHQHLPFDQLVEALKPPRSLAYAPLVQVLFDVQEDNTTDWQLDGLRVKSLPFSQQRAKFDLHVSFLETPAGLKGIINYRTDLFRPATVAQMATDLVGLMTDLLAHPDQPLSTYQEAAVSAAVSNDTAVDAPPEAYADDPPGLMLETPHEATLALLRSVWCWLLDLPAIDLDDDFFDLGGHSLLAFQMTAELHQQTDFLIPVASVFANPTLRKLTSYLHETQPELVWHSLVAVNESGSRPPLFLVHPLSGDIEYVYQLAARLAREQPVYGLRSVGLNGVADPMTSIGDMANYYLQLIMERQPDGPYALGGYSLGGVIAFEMARQLRQRGKTVQLLALIDAYPITPSLTSSQRVEAGQLARYYYEYWRSLPRRPDLLWPILLRKAPTAARNVLNRWINVLLAGTTPSPTLTTSEPGLSTTNRLVAANQQAQSTYAFAPYDGHVVLLRTTGTADLTQHQQAYDLGWKRYARQGASVHLLPGNHSTIFTDDATVSLVATVLSTYLPT